MKVLASFLFCCICFLNVRGQCALAVTVTALSSTSVNVTVSPFNSGIYYLGWVCGDKSGQIAGLTSATTKVSNLTPGCTFNALVLSPLTCGFFPGIAQSQITLPCAPPVISATAYGTTATFNWNAVAGASNYRLFYKVRSAPNWTNVITGNVTNYSLTGLMADSVYYTYVCGLNCPVFGAMTQPSNYVSFYTSTAACGPSASVTAVSNVCNQITANLSGGTGTWVLHGQRIFPPPITWISYEVSSPVVNLSVLPTSNETYLMSTQTLCGATASIMSNTEIISNAKRAPGKTTISQINCQGFNVKWPLTSTNYAFRLLTRPVGSSVWTTQYLGFDTTFTVATLSSNIVYEVAVRTLFCGVQSGLSAIQTIYTDGAGCRVEDEVFVTPPTRLTVYPNPTSGMLYVDLEQGDTPIRFAIYNTLGQLKSSGELDTSNAIDAGEISNGCYYLQLYAASQQLGAVRFLVAK